jgi:hypothetical protein
MEEIEEFCLIVQSFQALQPAKNVQFESSIEAFVHDILAFKKQPPLIPDLIEFDSDKEQAEGPKFQQIIIGDQSKAKEEMFFAYLKDTQLH